MYIKSNSNTFIKWHFMVIHNRPSAMYSCPVSTFAATRGSLRGYSGVVKQGYSEQCCGQFTRTSHFPCKGVKYCFAVEGINATAVLMLQLNRKEGATAPSLVIKDPTAPNLPNWNLPVQQCSHSQFSVRARKC